MGNGEILRVEKPREHGRRGEQLLCCCLLVWGRLMDRVAGAFLPLLMSEI